MRLRKMARNPNWPKMPKKVKEHKPTEKQLKEARDELYSQAHWKTVFPISVEDAKEGTICEVIRQIWRLATREPSAEMLKNIQRHCETAIAMAKRMDKKLKEYKESNDMEEHIKNRAVLLQGDRH